VKTVMGAYQGNSNELSHYEDVRQEVEPLGDVSLQVQEEVSLRFISECPVSRYSHSEERRQDDCVADEQPLEHLPRRWWSQGCLNPKEETETHSFLHSQTVGCRFFNI
jgi:hypothetical protein